MPVKLYSKTALIEFSVLQNMEHNILGISGMQALDLTYDAEARQVFSTQAQDDSVTTIE